jgi:hypothetical protein
MASTKINASWWLLILAGGAAVAFVFCLSHRQPDPASQTQVAPGSPSFKTAEAQSMADNPARSANEDDRSLQEVCEALRKESDAQVSRQKLAELRQKLAAMPTNAAVALIRRFLDAKADASTHLGFKVASDGMLDEAPTLRTFLLDELGRLDPVAAADYSKTVLASMDSPDEWALALRNLALGDSSDDGAALLEEKTTQMLQYAPWQQNPSAGFLESFDVAVYLGGADFVPTLSDLVRSQDNPAVAHAAFLALDRLVINDPATVLESLEDEPDLMEGRESTRADYFARANVSDPEQRQVLENYLLDPAISTTELQTFAGIYPNANFMISPNLLTQATTPGRDALMNLDAQSLAVVQEWLADPRFAQVAPELQIITQRLEGFAAQAKRGP